MSNYDIVEIKKKMNKDNDVNMSNVHRPHHYSQHGMTLAEAFEGGLISKKETITFYKTNILKYIIRFEDKNKLEDLYKAKEYLELLINFYNK